MGETLAQRVTLREAQRAADVLREAAREAIKGKHRAWFPDADARAQSLRRVAEWIEQEAMRDG